MLNILKVKLPEATKGFPNEKKKLQIILPSGETDVLDVALRTCRPLTIHFISAGGLEGAVVHWSGTRSPTLASDGPDIDTCVGATVCMIMGGYGTQWKIKSKIVFSSALCY